ncbi:MAG: hypothetical protein ABJA85_00700, partial [Bacteroidota bacterium]
MKKLSVFILSSLFALTLSATGRQPQVTINTSNNYEVRIDGNNYYGNNTIPNLNQGTHAVQVYQVRKGLFGKNRTLVSTSSFQLYNNDVNIFVDSNGQLRINESGNYNNNNTGKRNRGRTDNDWNGNRNRNRNNDGNDDRDNESNDDDNGNYHNKKAKHNNGNGHG